MSCYHVNIDEVFESKFLLQLSLQPRLLSMITNNKQVVLHRRQGQVGSGQGRGGEKRREEERGEERGGEEEEEVWLGARVSGPLWGLGVLVYWGSFGALGS